ncbi:PREDICTED: nucleotide exchange factor SIL1 [Nicrophorus vespilloides]|uniref:Nucleotide exchange factor SIL1 n=1 Tax=Nicrophorus vespilloides TaxID=110193 RepID=A0ABM1MAI8_NICVS|nr:PREDICTED: nucleotide exchange factor SIL1 [Nicrophorus vespilloides]
MVALREIFSEYTYTKIAIGVVCILLYVGLISGKENREEMLEDGADEVFVPTDEWKVVKKGQKIPAGLHVRMNLETGLNEAKLLDGGSKSKSGAVATTVATTSQEKKSNHLLPGVNLEKVKFKSYDQIKKELRDANVVPKTDMEVLKELVDRHEKNGASLKLLEDLEYLGHQYDNALEFIRLDGFRTVIHHNLNGSNLIDYEEEHEDELKRMTLVLLGSLAQNNPKVQIHAMETNTLTMLQRLLGERNPDVRSSAVYALGSVLRRFPFAQRKFGESGGFENLVDLIESGNIKVGLKVITLLSDLLNEMEQVEEEKELNKIEQYRQVEVRNRLLALNYNNILTTFLVNVVKADPADEDGIEICTVAIKQIGATTKDRRLNAEL